MKMKEMIWLDEGRDSKESGAEIISRIFVECYAPTARIPKAGNLHEGRTSRTA